MKNQKLLYSSFLTLFFLLSGFVQGQDLKTIKGKITYKDQPLQNAHVVNLDSKASVKTSSEGSYQIQAKIGEELSFSYVGLKTIKVIIEDVTTTLNIKMTEKVNELNTVVVKSNKKRGKSQTIFSKKLAKIPTAFGELDLKKVGFSVDYIRGKDLNLAAAAYNAAPAIAAKIPNVFSPDEISGLLYVSRGAKPDPVLWDIDGALMDRAPAWLQASDIVDVYLLKNAPARYGNKSVVIVITENNPAIYAQKKKLRNIKIKIFTMLLL